mgnify:CR=1 FL=1
MSATRSTRLLIVGVALLALISLMLISVDPEVQYTVDEIMESPSDFEDEEVEDDNLVHLSYSDLLIQMHEGK